MTDARNSVVVAFVIVGVLTLCGCGHAAPRTDGYKPGAVPGTTRDRAEAILGKPDSVSPFSLPGTGVDAEVLTYPFGQVLVQNGEVVAVSVNNDPEFRGPFGVTIGMSEDNLYAALAAHPRSRAGHRESYDAIEKTSDTRTKDIYDETDHVIIELTAANANDALAPFNVAQVTLVNGKGMNLIEAFTKARVAGLYPEVHVDNFISDPWRGKR